MPYLWRRVCPKPRPSACGILRCFGVEGGRNFLKGALTLDFAAVGQILEPAARRGRFGAVSMVFQKFAQRFRGVFIASHSCKRLRHQKLDLGSLSCGRRQSLLRCLKRLLVLLVMVVRLR